MANRQVGAPEGLPPQDMAMERAVLGSLLIDPDAIYAVAPLIDQHDFYRESHGQIYQAIYHLHETSAPIDFLTVVHALEAAELLEAVGGTAYLTGLVEETPTAANVGHYATTLRQLTQKRRLIILGSKVAQVGYSNNSSADLLARDALKEFGEIIARGQKEDTIYTPSQLAALPPLEYLVGDGILPVGGRMVLYGPKKGGKTRLMIEFALSLVSGTPFLGRFAIPTKSRVLFVQRDMPLSGFGEWMGKALEAFGLGQDCDLTVAEGRGIDLATANGAAKLSQLVARSQCQVLIIDCLRRMHSGEENSSTEMEAVFQALDTIRSQYQLKGLILVAHTRKLLAASKLTPDDCRGTGGLLDWVDSAIGHDGREGIDNAHLTFLLRFGEVEDLALNWNWETFRWASSTTDEAREMPLHMAEYVIKGAGGKLSRKAYLAEMKKETIRERASRRVLDELLRQGIVALEDSKLYDPNASRNSMHIILKTATFFKTPPQSENSDAISF